MQNKTTIQAILDITAPDLRTKIAKYLTQDLDAPQSRFQDLKDLLRIGFDWSSTLEGFDHWYAIYMQLVESY
jgi:hypothetical protein